MDLRQSTAGQTITVGVFIHATDVTPMTALTITNTDIKIKKWGVAETAKNSGGATHVANGRYSLTLDATDTNTLGPGEINIQMPDALPVRREFRVLSAAVYDQIYGTDPLAALTPTEASHLLSLTNTDLSGLEASLAALDLSALAVLATAVQSLSQAESTRYALLKQQLAMLMDALPGPGVSPPLPDPDSGGGLSYPLSYVNHDFPTRDALKITGVPAGSILGIYTQDSYAQNGPPTATTPLSASGRWLHGVFLPTGNYVLLVAGYPATETMFST